MLFNGESSDKRFRRHIYGEEGNSRKSILMRFVLAKRGQILRFKQDLHRGLLKDKKINKATTTFVSIQPRQAFQI